jgi:hypothetical protein
MDAKENRRMFSRHLVDSQSSLQVGLWCSRDKPTDKQYFKSLIDISSGGFSFSSGPEDDIFSPGTFLDKIEIFSSEGRLLQTSGEVRHIYCSSENLRKSSYKVGVKFELEFTDNERLHKANLKKLHEKIIDPAFIFNNLKSLVENRIPVSLENIEHPTHPITIGYFTQFLNSHKFFTLTFKPANHKLSKLFCDDLDRVQVIYQLNADGYRFASIVISQAQNEVTIKLPKSIMHLWQRNTLRYLSPSQNPLMVKIIHPLLNNKLLKFKVIDLTPEGFSIAMVYPNDLFVEGMVFSQATLIIPLKRRINTSVEVKYIGMAMDEKTRSYLKCGFHFVNLPQKEVNFIVAYLLDKKYPYLKVTPVEQAKSI